jgi:hypothetical protein
MQIVHDVDADLITLVQVPEPAGAWGLCVPVGVLCAALGVWGWSTVDSGRGLAIASGALGAAAMFWLAAAALTETTATFDGRTRILAVRRRRPWGSPRRDIRFDEVFGIEAGGRWTLDGTDHRIDIALADERTIRLRYYPAEQKDVDRAVATALGILRRPRQPAA